MQLKFLATYWGSEGIAPDTFIQRAVQAGYQGIEVYMPPGNDDFAHALGKAVAAQKQRDPGFMWVLQHITPYVPQEGVAAYRQRDLQQLQTVLACQPDVVNAHTGKDFFSFEDNCSIIEGYAALSHASGIPVLHETHRGRFAFHAATLLGYLHAFPHLQLTADYTHFCTVSESMLHDQEGLLQQLLPRVAHVHARVGFEEAPQVNNPFAPEWAAHLQRFTAWWQQIARLHAAAGKPFLTITPEFGPPPYMPVEPFTCRPLANQWDINYEMMRYLQVHLQTAAA